MLIDILSLFPEYFQGPLDVSMLRRARDKGIVDIRLTNMRDFADNKHRRVDDRPFGGGPGMVLMPGPVASAIRHVKREGSYTIYLSPQGRPLTAALSEELSLRPHLILLCGHYEGVDQRLLDKEVDLEISIGDYVLFSGCPAALVLVEAIARFLPGVLGDEEAAQNDSFSEGILEGPQYTRPEEFEGVQVPAVLRGGDHAKIKQWRTVEALKKTERVRPELLLGLGE